MDGRVARGEFVDARAGCGTGAQGDRREAAAAHFVDCLSSRFTKMGYQLFPIIVESKVFAYAVGAVIRVLE